MTLQHSTLAAIALSLFTAACSATTASMGAADPGVATSQPTTVGTPTTGATPTMVATPTTGATPTMVATPMTRATYEPNGDAFTLVLMRVNSDMHTPSHDELAELTTGHSEFMQAMTEEGYVLAQGPIVPPRSAGGLRSMYFIDSDDSIGAYERVCNDPAAESGLYEMEAINFITESNIRAFASMERTVRMSETYMPQMRPYIAVIAPSSAAMTAMLNQMGEAIVFYGHCTDGTLADSTLCFVDANTIDEARQIMAVTGAEADDFEYHAWVSSAIADEMN